MGRSRKLGLVALALALSCVGSLAVAQRHTAGYAWADPDWRFTHHDRPIKVVLLAGSIGASPNRPYPRLLHEWCENVEVRNLSQVGHGAPQLASRFRSEVLENPNVPIRAPGTEVWLMFGGGMNSVGAPHRTNRAIRRTFELAHRRGVRVVSLSLTPWGDDGDDDERWEGGRALHALKATRNVVGFQLGRLSPAEALGQFARERSNPGQGWSDAERPDVVVDLYDSPLRDRDAEPWPLDDVRRKIERDARWRASVSELSDAEREARLEADARLMASAPRWFLRREYRGFDHIHPNPAGHQVIAETICPRLPESWGCRCP